MNSPGIAVRLAAALLAAGALAGAASLGARQGVVSEAAEARLEIEKLLAEQSAAWNRGDLDAFCAVYAEDATFLTPTGVTKGRAEVLARYRKKYPDAAARGTLSLEPFEWRAEAARLANPDPARFKNVPTVAVAARWKLEYPAKPAASGVTLLVFVRDAANGWRIAFDASM